MYGNKLKTAKGTLNHGITHARDAVWNFWQGAYLTFWAKT
jgi:hypothetical protein